MRALVIGNREDADVGVLGEWAARAGIALETVAREARRLPALDGWALVISLGSVWRLHDPELQEVLRPEQALLRDAVAADVPVLAICFGMQQLTAAFGGTVYATATPEIGFCQVQVSDDPAGVTIPSGPWMEYHYDACTLPAGAVELARNDHGLQAYRQGSALAVQFHPEVDRPVLERWAEESAPELAAAGRSREWMVQQAREHTAASRLAALDLFDGFWSHAGTVPSR